MNSQAGTRSLWSEEDGFRGPQNLPQEKVTLELSFFKEHDNTIRILTHS